MSDSLLWFQLQCSNRNEYRKHYTNFSSIFLDGCCRRYKLQCAIPENGNHSMEHRNYFYNQFYCKRINGSYNV